MVDQQHTPRDSQPTLTPLTYYQSLRSRDGSIEVMAAQARSFVKTWTGGDSFVGGSVAMKLNIQSSDLDLIVPVLESNYQRVGATLRRWCQFRGERQATPETYRQLFCIRIEEMHIDFNVMLVADAALMRTAIQTANRVLSSQERVAHVWRKYRLYTNENHVEYEASKLEIYNRFFPDFVWKTDQQIRSELVLEKRVAAFNLIEPPPQYSGFGF
jgi:hypothetical protein